MTVQQTFFDWARSGLNWDAPPYEACSPNLLAVKSYLDARYEQGAYLGCHNDRDVRAGSTPSEHSWGAAMDWSYQPGLREQTCRWLIDNSRELGICAIHDYLGCRIWRAGRTSSVADAHTLWWRAQTPSTSNGMGQSWATYLHLVTTRDAFADTTPVADRLQSEEDDMRALKPHVRIFNSALTMDRRTPENPDGICLPDQPLFMAVPPSVTGGVAASAVMVAIGAHQWRGPGYVEAYEGTSLVNFAGDGLATANLALVGLANGGFTITPRISPTHLYVDVQGYVV